MTEHQSSTAVTGDQFAIVLTAASLIAAACVLWTAIAATWGG